ncbi:MAG: hypothetical protein AAF724_22290 [Pseudomonadota bacterium]
MYFWMYVRWIRACHMGHVLVLLAIGFGLISNAEAQEDKVTPLAGNSHLYSGETLVEASGFEALYRFVPGEGTNPMIVFVPGDAHLARIFYGYPGGKSEDFVAYWVGQAGHPFLGVSFPMANPVFTQAAPGYTIEDWGNQVVAVIKHVMAENNLSGPVIVAGWSMGGKIAASLGRAAKSADLEIEMFVAMSADPPVPGFLPPANTKSIKLDSSGYADRSPIYDWFFNAVAEQNRYNGHTIIPKDTYADQFIGATPLDLIDTGMVFKDGEMVPDIESAIKTSAAFQFDDYPFPVVIHDDSTSDLENVLLDSSDWAFVRNRVLMNRILAGRKPSDLSQPEWQRLRLMMETSQSYFTEVVEGNHFFFIGEIGARDTVAKILRQRDRVASVE